MSNNLESTLVIIKPDGVQRNLIGPIISRLESRGLKMTAIKMLKMDRTLAEAFYDVHAERPFFHGLIEFMTSGPVVAIIWHGIEAISSVRQTMGDTNPLQAQSGTIRGDLGLDIGRNLIHGSDSLERADIEATLLFGQNEGEEYTKDIDRWIRES